ncbi:MAG TPA: hypothetical protein PK020_20150 [Ilumatobacteraceae bacterium]|nr:hypothetical protein [Ilumatobacteraceae bacterium]
MNNDYLDDTGELLDEAFSRVTYQRELSDIIVQPPARRWRRRTAALAITGTVAVAALAAGGMAAARRGLPDAVSYAKDVRSTEQAAALTDDEVTFDEYEAGFQRFSDCMRSDGRPISDVSFDPLTQLFNYAYDGIDDCYERELYALDVSWQLSGARPRDPAHPDISAVEVLAACKAGDPPPVGLPQDQFEVMCRLFAEAEAQRAGG